jgi:single-stranded DNA-binding protein
MARRNRPSAKVHSAPNRTMLSILATGTLIRNPERRTSATGKTYGTALVRVAVDGEEAVLLSVIVFSETVVTALLGLSKGDVLAVTGTAKLTAWERNGEQHHGMSMIASRVMTAYEAGKHRKQAQATQGGSAPA